MKTREDLVESCPSSVLLAHSRKFWGTRMEFTRSENATIRAINILSPSFPSQCSEIATLVAVAGESCGSSQLGANTLYISRNSDEKITGRVGWFSTQVKVGGTVSI